MPELFTLAEAAAIAGIPAATIRTAIEKRSFTPKHRKRVGKANRHRFSEGDLLLMKTLAQFPFPLSKSDKAALAQVLQNDRGTAGPWARRGAELVYLSSEIKLHFTIGGLMRELKRNLQLFQYGAKRIMSSPDILGGEPVFRGTRVSLQHLAGLYRKKVSETEIAEDFAHLSYRDLEYARLASRFIAKPGRPKGPIKLIRVARP
ncbi:MAG: DUF433 domain-containing protein [Bryobacteraceae bacterium]